MNAHRHRPAFNRPRRPLAWALLLTFSAQCVVPPALAQIVAYRSAPASQRPTVLSAGNGIPLINIQTPSAAGVSRNTYEQFDIATQGAILNNSRTNVQTQLGGWVQGNPWLATGGARVILNEVISANPSQLLGYVEVAGNPAQVVIANPAGVTCNGCGFINASRATLTTGTPILNGGNLDGYRVEGGTIRVEGAGLDASRAGYTDLIARAVEVNAGIWAQSLQVTAGANVVSADNVSATPIGGSGGSPAFAIDVAQLGGMYAGKIVLVGTEAGVGVRNAGQIGAGVGEVVVTVDGQLVNTGLINGSKTRLAAATLDNLGSGRIYGDHLAIAATTLNNRDDAGHSPVIAARDRLDLGVGTLNNRNDDPTTDDLAATRLFSAADLAIGGGLDADGHATGSAALVHNHGATIEALGDLAITAADIRNTNAGFVTRTVSDGSQLIQEVQPEGWPQRHDIAHFPSIFDHNLERQPCVGDICLYSPFEDYTFYEYTASATKTELVSSRAGRIIAGGDITLSGNLLNDDSRILAGGTLTQRGGTLTNLSTEGIRTITYSGWAQFRDWDGRDEELDFGGVYAFNPAATITHVDLGIARYADQVSSPTGAAPGGLAGGMFALAPTGNYLIETDPQFAGYRQWLSSDYLLQALASDPATTQKRLGDGFYEQRLITEQIAQLTGRRFLDGHANDEAQYQALMNAGITYAQAWQLIPGVALTAEQIAQLTSDMVWLVEQEIMLPDGSTQKVLAPRLYARVRDGDLTPAGGLLSAERIDIAVSGDLTNRGTIAGRQLVSLAANNVRNLGGNIRGEQVELVAGNDVTMRGGTITAGNRLDLIAGNHIDIASTTQTSINETTNGTYARTHLDRIAALYVQGAKGELTLYTGNDITLTGARIVNEGVGATTLIAGRDLTLAALTTGREEHYTLGGGDRRDDTTSQTIGTGITAGGHLDLAAGRDLTAIAGQINAAGDAGLQAGRDLTLAAAADSARSQQHYKNGGKKFEAEGLRIQQQTTDITAGGNLALAAGRDLTLIASQAKAGADAYLIAGRDIALLTAENQDYLTFDKKQKSSGGRKQTQHDELNTITQIGSGIEAGTNLTVDSGGNQRHQVANLKAADNLTLESGGDIVFEGKKDLKQESHEKSSSSWAWNSMKGQGTTDETLRQSQLVAGGELAIKAAGKIHIDIPEVNRQTVAQTIDALVQAEPQLAWLKDMEQRGDIDWRRVKEVHDQWQYSHSGMGTVLTVIIAIVVTVVTWGAASGAIAGAANAGAGTAAAAAGSTMAVGGAVNTALTAAVTSMASNAAINTINNGGDLGKALEQTFSDEAMKGYVTSALTAGLTQGATQYLQDQGLLTSSLGDATFNQRFTTYTTKAVIGAGVQSAVMGEPLDETLETALVASLAQSLTSEIGDWGKGSETMVAKTLAHAVVQCAAASIQGNDCGSAALGGATAELLSGSLDGLDARTKEAGFQQSLGSAIAGMAAMLVAELTGRDAITALNSAQTVDIFNRQLHPGEQNLAKKLAKESNGKYTEKEIADALRWASNTDLNETAQSHMVVPLDSETPASAVYDAQSMTLANNGGQAVLYQDMSKITPPSNELMAFIQGGTGETYRWDSSVWQSGNTPSTAGSGTRYGLFTADGQTFSLPLADCPAGGCATSPIAWASTDPKDQAALQAYTQAARQQILEDTAKIAVVGTAASPIGLGSLTASGLASWRTATAFGLGATFQTAGDYVKGNDLSLIGSLTSGGIAALYAPLFGASMLGNAAIGGAALGSNAMVQNQFLGAGESVWTNYRAGVLFSGLGTVAGNWAQQAAGKVVAPWIRATPFNPAIPALLQAPAQPNPLPGQIGNAVNAGISNLPPFLDTSKPKQGE